MSSEQATTENGASNLDGLHAGQQRAAGLLSVIGLGALVATLALLPTGGISATAFCLLMIGLPLLVAVAHSLLRGLPTTVATPGNVVALAHFVFFGAGYLEYLQNDRRIAFGLYGQVGDGPVVQVLASVGIITTALVLGLDTWAPQLDSQVSRNAPLPRWISWVQHGLFLLVAVGFGQTVIASGGLAAASATLQLHDKQANQLVAGIGTSLWSLFATPTLLVCGFAALTPRGRGRHRAVGAAEFVLLSTAAFLVYGSRLTVIVAVVGLVAARFISSLRPVRLYVLGLGLVGIVVLSFLILQARADAQANTTASTSGLDILSYSVFDVSVAAGQQRSDIGPLVAAPQRFVTLVSAALPKFGDSSSDLNQSLLDVIMAQQLGNAAQAQTSGLPPSLPTFLWLGYGTWGGASIGFVIGAVGALACRLALARRSPLRFVIYGLLVSFIFNSFKGGDVIVDLSSEVRRWAYLSLMIAIAGLLAKWVTTLSARRDEPRGEVGQWL